MIKKIKQAFAWLIKQANACLVWVSDNRALLPEQGRKMARQVHKVLLKAQRQAWARFNQGRALAILTVQYRQEGAAFRQALEQAKAEVWSMSEAETALLVVDFFSAPSDFPAWRRTTLPLCHQNKGNKTVKEEDRWGSAP
jgi:hypothetical protein